MLIFFFLISFSACLFKVSLSYENINFDAEKHTIIVFLSPNNMLLQFVFDLQLASAEHYLSFGNHDISPCSVSLLLQSILTF